MNNDAMKCFLSERNISLHHEYLESCRLRFSILAKSGYDISGRRYPELLTMRLGDAKEEILALSREICFHEAYFSSFGEGGAALPEMCVEYRSVASFLYALECRAMAEDGGFLLIFRIGEKVRILHSSERYSSRLGEPCLALDLAEHAYFTDYGFDKRAYVRAALLRLELSSLDKK